MFITLTRLDYFTNWSQTCKIYELKRQMLVIGNALKPRCFQNFNSNIYCTYRANASAWMTASIFQEWICQFDVKMKKEGKEILLLVDNATSHKTPANLSNIHIHYLPPNMTASIQPLDAGIINSSVSYSCKRW